MKYLKYVAFCIMTLCFIPKVSASQTVKYKEYKVGDEIIVHLDKQDGNIKQKFKVIASSSAGEDVYEDKYEQDPAKAYQYVVAIYDGTIGESFYAKEPASSIAFKDSNLFSNLVTTVRNKGWVSPNEFRLLTSDDIESLFGKKNPSASEIKNKYAWLVLDTPYWLGDAGQKGLVHATCTSGAEQYDCSKTENAAKVMHSSGELLFYKQEDTVGIRPVIKVHKGFVDGGMDCSTGPIVIPDPKPTPDPTPTPNPTPDVPTKEEMFCPNDSKISIQSCIDSGIKESECIKKLCPGTKKPDNPKTGTYISFGILMIAMVVGIASLCINKKKYFRKI